MVVTIERLDQMRSVNWHHPFYHQAISLDHNMLSEDWDVIITHDSIAQGTIRIEVSGLGYSTVSLVKIDDALQEVIKATIEKSKSNIRHQFHEESDEPC